MFIEENLKKKLPINTLKYTLLQWIQLTLFLFPVAIFFLEHSSQPYSSACFLLILQNLVFNGTCPQKSFQTSYLRSSANMLLFNLWASSAFLKYLWSWTLVYAGTTMTNMINRISTIMELAILMETAKKQTKMKVHIKFCCSYM